jgi:hypothetical protein
MIKYGEPIITNIIHLQDDDLDNLEIDDDENVEEAQRNEN